MISMPKHIPISHMSPDELRQWLTTRRTALTRKMVREQNYLAHRARRGTRTPTDEAYEQDLVLEADLLALLNEMLETLGTLEDGEGEG